MNISYTQDTRDYFLDMADTDIGNIWEDIQSTPTDTAKDLWKKKLNRISQDYSLSSRFALMRILCCRANGNPVSDNALSTSASDFDMTVQGKHYHFSDISLFHADHLAEDESLQYLSCLTELADPRSDEDSAVTRSLLSKAWYNCICKNILTREEALQLGHALHFTLPEMQWFLLRTFDVGDSLHFNHSNDLIDAYGFLSGANWQRLQQLKSRYEQFSAGIPKANTPERCSGWTQNISDSLFEKVNSWKGDSEAMDAQFLKWMQTQASNLDLPSRTAGRIYRNLAAFAHDLITGEASIPDEEEFADCIQDIYEYTSDSPAARNLLFEDGILSRVRCKEVADTLMLENKILSASIQKDNTKAWHVLSTLDNGTLTSAGGIVNRGRTRVADILSGSIQAEKGDMLYLLWFISNLVWQISDVPDAYTICCRVMDFMDTAKYLLEAALLPEFYPPHPMEQSMLLSIVCGIGEDDTPSVVYEYMLHSLTRERKRETGSQKHDIARKIEIVNEYRNNPELTLNQCALKYGISPKTVSAWQKQLLEEGKIH